MPLVDVLMKMPSVEAASVASVRLVAATLVGVAVGSLVLGAIDRVTGGELGKSKYGVLNVPVAAVASVLKPAQAS